MDGFLDDLEYSLWDIWYGCDFGTYRFQLGNLIVENQIVDGLFKVDTGLKTCRLNLLEEMGNGDYIFWGIYYTRRSGIEALRSLINYQEFVGQSGRPIRDYEKKGGTIEGAF